MATAQTPQMPLLANLWYLLPALPPQAAPDVLEVECSLAPMRPVEFWGGGSLWDRAWTPTHVLRTIYDPGIADSFVNADPFPSFPSSVFEVPAWSNHFYIVTWSHQVGAGFPNHHTRCYCVRWTAGAPTVNPPYFQGWI